ncbi:MAG TPA: hypothetical protein VKY92_23955 [Verrucomicrobiae bacterium]|nr:hypothetical protein [Verrucomicrobiae bacterium]
MKTKRNSTAAGLALTVLTLLALPRPVLAGDHQLRIKGEETGAVFPGAFQFPFHFESLAATGKASHLGRYTLTGNFAVDVRVGMSTGMFTLSTRDGDELFLTEAGHGVAIGDFIHKISVYTITSGTGRFEGATGSITTSLTFGFPLNQDISPNPYVAELTGFIVLAEEDCDRDN